MSSPAARPGRRSARRCPGRPRRASPRTSAPRPRSPPPRPDRARTAARRRTPRPGRRPAARRRRRRPARRAAPASAAAASGTTSVTPTSSTSGETAQHPRVTLRHPAGADQSHPALPHPDAPSPTVSCCRAEQSPGLSRNQTFTCRERTVVTAVIKLLAEHPVSTCTGVGKPDSVFPPRIWGVPVRDTETTVSPVVEAWATYRTDVGGGLAGAPADARQGEHPGQRGAAGPQRGGHRRRDRRRRSGST